MTITKANAAQALVAFDYRHGSVVLQSLATYADYMREMADEAEIEAWCPERPPVPPQPAADGGMTINVRPAPRGWARMTVMFRDSAASADKARDAYQQLLDVIDPGDDEDQEV
jgi:hypothetical protein